MSNIEEKTENLVKSKIEQLGYELYDIQFVKEGKDYFLRIFIDNKNGISLEDCEKVNNGITDILDQADYIKQQYFLEISSPGIERILRKDKHLEDNLNEEVSVSLFKPIDKKREIIGNLKGYNQEEIIINAEEQEMKINRKDIAQIKKIYKW